MASGGDKHKSGNIQEKIPADPSDNGMAPGVHVPVLIRRSSKSAKRQGQSNHIEIIQNR